MAEVMTAREPAQHLRTSVGTIRRMARRGGLPAAKVGRSWRFRREDVDDWFATGGSEGERVVTEGLAAVTRERMAAARDEGSTGMTSGDPEE
jgi:excisionase family DNA binding protein